MSAAAKIRSRAPTLSGAGRHYRERGAVRPTHVLVAVALALAGGTLALVARNARRPTMAERPSLPTSPAVAEDDGRDRPIGPAAAAATPSGRSDGLFPAAADAEPQPSPIVPTSSGSPTATGADAVEPAAARCWGFVLDEFGAPIPGARVSLSAGEPGKRETVARAKTGADGRYELSVDADSFASVPGGQADLLWGGESPDGVQWSGSATVDLVLGSVTRRDVRRMAPGPHAVRVEIRIGPRIPEWSARGLMLTVTQTEPGYTRIPGWALRHRVEVGLEGTVSVSGLRAGRAHAVLRWHGDGRESGDASHDSTLWVRGFHVSGDETITADLRIGLLEISLDPLARWPARGHPVYVMEPGPPPLGHGSHVAQVQAKVGTAKFVPVIADREYLVSIYPGGLPSLRRSIRVSPGQVSRILFGESGK